MQPVDFQHDHIRPLAHFQRASHLAHVQRPRPTNCRHLHYGAGWHHHRIARAALGQQCDQAHLLEMIHVVVAGRAIRADADMHANFQHLGHIGDAAGQLEIGRRVVADRRASILQNTHLVFVDSGAVCTNNLGLQHAALLDPIHHRHAMFTLAFFHFGESLADVNV